MIRLRRDRGLDPLGRVRLGGEIVLAYGAAVRELRRRPIEQVVTRLRRGLAPGEAAHSPAALGESLRLGDIVVRVLRFLPGDTRCLRRSLVLLRLLSRRGIPARLVIAARSDPHFLAHAWLEYDGRPVLPPGDAGFGRLVEL
ncbi:MAG TPA: lasso peptide biosynthesis B2 protein [Solirubrobacterales bacterium]